MEQPKASLFPLDMIKRYDNIDPTFNPVKARYYQRADSRNLTVHLWIEIIKNVGSNSHVIITCKGKTGCQPKGSKVLMSNGEWKNIENIKVGDEVLSPQKDGTNIFSKVLNTTEWFSKENYDVYELNRQKRKLYTCSYNHIIPINYLYIPKFDGKKYSFLKKWKVRQYTAREYHKYSDYQKQHKLVGFSSHLIDKFKDRLNCEIEPYTLGFFLGDGHFFSKKYMKPNNEYNEMKRKDKKYFHKKLTRTIGITTSNSKIIEEISKFYKIMNIHSREGTIAKIYTFSINGNLSKLLIKYGLDGKGSGKKFIPKEALLSDSNYRKKLLAGLIDSDGYYKSGGYSITTKSKQLSRDILFLVHTLGGRGRIKKVKKGIKKLNFIGEYYRVSFYLGDMKLPMKLKRKNRDITSMYISSNRIGINTIMSKPSKVYGFEIDSPSKWYITDNFMVTHNSGKTYSGLIVALFICAVTGVELIPEWVYKLNIGTFKKNYEDGDKEDQEKLLEAFRKGMIPISFNRTQLMKQKDYRVSQGNYIGCVFILDERPKSQKVGTGSKREKWQVEDLQDEMRSLKMSFIRISPTTEENEHPYFVLEALKQFDKKSNKSRCYIYFTQDDIIDTYPSGYVWVDKPPESTLNVYEFLKLNNQKRKLKGKPIGRMRILKEKAKDVVNTPDWFLLETKKLKRMRVNEVYEGNFTTKEIDFIYEYTKTVEREFEDHRRKEREKSYLESIKNRPKETIIKREQTKKEIPIPKEEIPIITKDKPKKKKLKLDDLSPDMKKRVLRMRAKCKEIIAKRK